MAGRRRDAYRDLYESALDIHSNLRPEEVISRIVQRAVKLLEAESANYYVHQPERGVLVPWVGHDRWEDEATVVLHSGEGVAGQVLHTGLPVAVERYDLWPHRSRKYEQGIVSRAAGVPVSRHGQMLGVLTVTRSLSDPPFDGEDLRLLTLFAEQAAIALENARVHREALEFERLEEELRVARRIQVSLLPARPADIPGHEVAVAYRPAREVGGDFYDFLPLRDGRWGLVVADVMDKGVPAALYMSLARTLVRTAGLSTEPPARVLARVNRHLWNDTIGEVLVTALYALLQPAEGRLSLASAGHSPALLIRGAEREVELVRSRGLVLGIGERVRLQERHLHLRPDDALLLYTDGVTEAMSPAGEAFDGQRLLGICRRLAGAPAVELVEAVQAEVEAHEAGQPASDDLTLLALRRQG